jgi:hypothetical protein
MKDHIHTIPVLDAFKASKDGGGCPFCLMYDKLERDAVAFIMGPAYMEDDVRMETNRLGFCGRHLNMMYANQNRLGLALMLHTHTQRLNKEMSGVKPGESMAKAVGSCYLCKRVDATFERYIETFFRLWNAGGDEARLIESAAGYCLPHFALISAMAEKQGKKTMNRFNDKILPAQISYMKQMEEDLEWFTQKFDYRNADAPWKNSKDALPRAIDMLGGSHK